MKLRGIMTLISVLLAWQYGTVSSSETFNPIVMLSFPFPVVSLSHSPPLHSFIQLSILGIRTLTGMGLSGYRRRAGYQAD